MFPNFSPGRSVGTIYVLWFKITTTTIIIMVIIIIVIIICDSFEPFTLARFF